MTTHSSLLRTLGLALLGTLIAWSSEAAATACLEQGFVSPPAPWPDYASADPVLVPSCAGTNSLTVDQIERVVFVGDSVVVGTPPATSADFFRSRLADQLVAHYGLAAPSPLWKAVDVINGSTVVQDSGDFSSCARWGARTTDLLAGDMQFAACFPAPALAERTLVVLMVGANDLSALAADADQGATPAALQADLDAALAALRAAVEWLVAPGRFPNGVFVVLANPLEFTDLTGDATTCPAAGTGGLASYAGLLDLFASANEEILDIALDNDVELVFARERFCGHGFAAGDPGAPCYRGPGNANWFDASCIHPNPTGHAELADDFFDVITTPAPLPVPGPPASAVSLLLSLGVALAARMAWRRAALPPR